MSISNIVTDKLIPGRVTEAYDQREAKARLIMGILLRDAGQLECAIELFFSAISFNPGLVEAYVRLGFALWQAGNAARMSVAFGEAVRLDPRAVRSALLEEPEEARLITLILYPKQYGMPQPPVDTERVVPFEVRDRDRRLTGAEGLVAEGHEAGAIRELERLLQEDPEELSPVPLLALAYLLLQATDRAGGTADNRGSMLWKVDPRLAKLLFPS
jgi:tetratricopeptide (TPR) repeat protein